MPVSRSLVASICGITACLVSGPLSAQTGNDITGQWRDAEGKAVVTIAPCGSGRMCGHITRVLAPQPTGGARDIHNPNQNLRTRSLVGVSILSGLEHSNGRWVGRGYSPEDGRNFNATVRINGNGMDLRGCVAIICRTVQWTRLRG